MKRIALVLMLALAACSSGGPKTVSTGATTTTVVSSTTATTDDIAAAGQRYLAIVKPLNDQGPAFQKAWAAINTGMAADYAKVAAPLIPLLQDQQQALIRGTWPQVAQADIKVLITETAAQIGDLASIGAQNLATIGNWVSQFTSDNAKTSAAASTVRADLGLPPPTS